MSVLRVPRSSIPASRKSFAGKDKCRKSVDIRNHPAFRIRSLREACRWNAGMPVDSGTGPAFRLISCDSRGLRLAGMPDAGMHEEATTWPA
jgi:hypothetical protein